MILASIQNSCMARMRTGSSPNSATACFRVASAATESFTYSARMTERATWQRIARSLRSLDSFSLKHVGREYFIAPDNPQIDVSCYGATRLSGRQHSHISRSVELLFLTSGSESCFRFRARHAFNSSTNPINRASLFTREESSCPSSKSSDGPAILE